jgi:hypothetical protein
MENKLMALILTLLTYLMGVLIYHYGGFEIAVLYLMVVIYHAIITK